MFEKIKRTLALLLALVLVFGVMPQMPVYAADEDVVLTPEEIIPEGDEGNMAKHRKLETPVLAAAKMLSFACALMSILATQTAMLTQFGDGNTKFARLMNAATGSVVCFLIFGLAVWMVRRANKEIKKMGA